VLLIAITINSASINGSRACWPALARVYELTFSTMKRPIMLFLVGTKLAVRNVMYLLLELLIALLLALLVACLLATLVALIALLVLLALLALLALSSLMLLDLTALIAALLLVLIRA